MDLDDKLPSKVSGVQSLSSSVQSTPEKNGHSDDASRSPELLQEFLKPGPKKELLKTCFDKDKKNFISSKTKMTDITKTAANNKISKKQDPKKSSSNQSNQLSKKQNRKGENPVRFPPTPEEPLEFGGSKSWVCKNSACRAVIPIADTFCKRCSCCICHLFDDNKDPSLWLVCSSESGLEDSCGLSCHVECALQKEKVGVVDLGQLMNLDGSYCCASCGKVSGVLGCWKKQMVVAKEARRLDVLCYRIYLSYRLLDRTSKFQELHEIVKEAKVKLETEVGPLNGVSAKMARGIVSRLSIAPDVLKLCSLAIEKVDERLAIISSVSPDCREDSFPSACKFIFEEITPSSVVIILIEPSKSSSVDEIKGYKLWYYKSRNESYSKEPNCMFPREQRRILVSNLQACTEYTFRIISYTESGDFGHSETKCFTKSVEFVQKNPNPAGARKENTLTGTKSSIGIDSSSSSEFKVRDLGKILHLAWAQEQGQLDPGFCSAAIKKCCGATPPTMTTMTAKVVKPETVQDEERLTSTRGLDLNVASVPDLNEELTPPFESSRDEDDTSSQDALKNANTNNINNNDDCLARSHGSGDSQTWTRGGPGGDAPAVDSQTEFCRKKRLFGRMNSEETHDCDSTLIDGSPFRVPNAGGSCGLDENFEYCVKIIRWLECEGHISLEFRLKLLTWFSLRSTEQERRVVNTFIQTMIDDPNSLAGQLVDSFTDIVSSKRQKNGFCSKLWH